mmetsp:Transcript_31920/g.85416  ORF Transcript_31920/g.85416 Transcript_31920/m.85416 type:complete len:155 (-) Transcript_31920:9-473(-)
MAGSSAKNTQSEPSTVSNPILSFVGLERNREADLYQEPGTVSKVFNSILSGVGLEQDHDSQKAMQYAGVLIKMDEKLGDWRRGELSRAEAKESCKRLMEQMESFQDLRRLDVAEELLLNAGVTEIRRQRMFYDYEAVTSESCFAHFFDFGHLCS